jgi:hypothetical protein
MIDPQLRTSHVATPSISLCGKHPSQVLKGVAAASAAPGGELPFKGSAEARQKVTPAPPTTFMMQPAVDAKMLAEIKKLPNRERQEKERKLPKSRLSIVSTPPQDDSCGQEQPGGSASFSAAQPALSLVHTVAGQQPLPPTSQSSKVKGVANEPTPRPSQSAQSETTTRPSKPKASELGAIRPRTITRKPATPNIFIPSKRVGNPANSAFGGSAGKAITHNWQAMDAIMKKLVTVAEPILRKDKWTEREILSYRERLMKGEGYLDFELKKSKAWDPTAARSHIGLWINGMLLPDMIRVREAAPLDFEDQLWKFANERFDYNNNKPKQSGVSKTANIKARFGSYGIAGP